MLCFPAKKIWSTHWVVDLPSLYWDHTFGIFIDNLRVTVGNNFSHRETRSASEGCHVSFTNRKKHRDVELVESEVDDELEEPDELEAGGFKAVKQIVS